MSESADFDEGEWRGQDFGREREVFKQRVEKRYKEVKKEKLNPDKLRAKSVSTDSSSPLVIIADNTRSMGRALVPVFSKLAYLDIEGKSYLGDDMETSFCAIGDAYTDEYPLQPRPFSKGLESKERLNELVVERGGGNNGGESYELAALYYSQKCSAPKAVRKPIAIFIVNDVPHELADYKQARRWAGVRLMTAMSARDIFEDMKSKFTVYVILRPPVPKALEGNKRNAFVYNRWVTLVGSERVKILKDPDRVVDLIFGILAEVTGKLEYFKSEMAGRQTEAQQKVVFEALGLDKVKPLGDTGPKMKSLDLNKAAPSGSKKPGWSL